MGGELQVMRGLILRAVVSVLAIVSIRTDAVANTKRILLVGDSHAAYMYHKRYLQRVLDQEGLGFADVEGASTAIGGLKASHFAANLVLPGSDMGLLERVAFMLVVYPTIDIVEVWLGANDILWEGWNTATPPELTEILLGAIQWNLEVVVDAILAVRRDLNVVLCDYDYFNCVETVDPSRPEYSTFSATNWAYWGQPTPEQLNGVLVALGLRKRAIAQARDRCFYIQNWGRMQHHFGYIPWFAPKVAPLPGQAPAYSPYPGGDAALASPPAAMADDEEHGGKDYLHFGIEGYMQIAGHCVGAHYREWLLNPPWPFATSPVPIHGLSNVSIDTDLSWAAGAGALAHDVYLGDSPQDLALVASDHPTTTYDPGALSYSAGYFWRVDEVFDDHTETGDLWYFSTESLAATQPNPAEGQTGVSVNAKLAWTSGTGALSHNVYFGDAPGSLTLVSDHQSATQYDPGTLAFSATYYWRIDEVFASETIPGELWTFSTQDVAATNPSPADGERYADVDADLTWTAAPGAVAHNVYFAASWAGLELVSEQQMETTYDPGALAENTTYVWRIDEVLPSGVAQGVVWSFTTGTEQFEATHPSPVDGEAKVSIHTWLRWLPGSGAVSHNVYFGESPDSLALVSAEQPALSHDPGELSYGATYSWRVDEVYAKGIVAGPVWSFTTQRDLPTAAFVAYPASGSVPLEVQFTDMSDPGIGVIEAWNWDFGDGTEGSTEQNPVHTYQEVGAYTVCLSVTSSLGSDVNIAENAVGVGPPLPVTGTAGLAILTGTMLLSALCALLRVPSLRVPSLRVPSLRVPSLRVPSLRVPSLRVPSLRVPSTGRDGKFLQAIGA